MNFSPDSFRSFSIIHGPERCCLFLFSLLSPSIHGCSFGQSPRFDRFFIYTGYLRLSSWPCTVTTDFRSFWRWDCSGLCPESISIFALPLRKLSRDYYSIWFSRQSCIMWPPGRLLSFHSLPYFTKFYIIAGLYYLCFTSYWAHCCPILELQPYLLYAFETHICLI